ncbi:unnamed protein product [Peniophora sp. CBMAI 1063]|nr:unnamed protein product [Peniophora sp. CBMAI 1063]
MPDKPSSKPFSLHMRMRISSGPAPPVGTYLRLSSIQASQNATSLTLDDVVDAQRSYEARLDFMEAQPSPSVPLRCRSCDRERFVLESVRELPGKEHWLAGLSCGDRVGVMALIVALYEEEHACSYAIGDAGRGAGASRVA